MSDRDSNKDLPGRDKHPAPGDDTTLGPDAIDSFEDDATRVLSATTAHSALDNDKTVLHENPTEQSSRGSDDATVLKGAAIPDDDVTRIAGHDSTDDATQSASTGLPDDKATRIGNADPSDSDSTIVAGHEGQDDEVTTIAGAGGHDEDATIIAGDKEAEDNDSTVVAERARPASANASTVAGGRDTTFIASVGAQRSRGTSEAGRLLKNRFVLEQKIGSGGMADVYKALDLRQQEAKDRNPYVAIKILKEDFARHPEAFISLQREASKTRGMPHPNIMAVYDFDKEGDTVFMAMELLTGDELADVLKKHPEGLDRELAWTLTRQICEALITAHGKNIVHSDFKPGNIFITADNIAKVLDFGIARAVENPAESSNEREETVFDAGSLGALTPTYASYEMLTGQVPSKSDDVYAAALVAYEMFTGKHPYGRTPADKAFQRKLVPERIPWMKRRHWRALERGLALQNDVRTQTMEEFMEGMFSEDLPIFRYAAVATIAAALIGWGTYNQFYQEEPVNEAYLAAKQALKIRKEDFIQLLNNPEFTGSWENSVRDGVRGINESAKALINDFGAEMESDEDGDVLTDDLLKYKDRIQTLYLQRAQGFIDRYDIGDPLDPDDLLDDAARLIDSVHTNDYNFAVNSTERVERSLEKSMRLRESGRREEEQRVSRIAAAQEAELAREQAEIAAAETIRRQREAFDTTFDDLQRQMVCRKTFREGEAINTTIASLEQIDPERYGQAKPDIIKQMADCIQRNRVLSPESAQVSRTIARAIYPEEKLLQVKIQNKDPCIRRSLEGRGARNKDCQDPLSVDGNGPELVVIPKGGNLGKFAIGKTEVKVGEFNLFCETTGCDPLPGSPGIPVTNISRDEAISYVNWLSDQTQRTYRLPTAQEWLYAARAVDDGRQPVNINCSVNSRGVKLGDNLMNALSGRPNGWGLYHYIGNARELATHGDELVALGGAHTDPIRECNTEKQIVHSGEADPVTGFRVYRQI